MSAAAPTVARRRKRASIWQRMLGAIGIGPAAKRSGVHYEAASTADRGRKGWTTSNAGPNAVGASAPYIRARSRDMARNDAHCARAIGVLAGNVVGTGVTVAPRADPKDERSKALAALAESLWRSWCGDPEADAPAQSPPCDAEGVHTYGALEGVMARGWIEAGEAFLRFRAAPELVRLGQVPLRLEVLEADMLDETKNERTTDAGGRIVQGVEVDAAGRRVAYWFFREHPGEGWPYGVGRSESVRTPAEDVIHLFLPLRPRQVRGVPFLAPVLATKADLDTWERAELARKATEACVVAFVMPGDDQYSANVPDEGLVPSVVDSDGMPVEDLPPRTVLRVRNGKDVKFNTPIISSNYDTYKRAMLQSIAVGVGLSYEWLSGDLSQANYSSLRGGLIEFWREIDALQWSHFVPKVTARVWRRFCEAAFLGGLLPVPYVPADFTAPARTSVDPARESLGDILDIRAALVPWEDKVAARGSTPRKVLDQASSLQKELGMLGLILDINPATTDFRGAMRNDRRQGQGGGSGVDGSGPPDDPSADGGESTP